MKKMCQCGHKHCCPHEAREEIKVDPKSRRSFKRKTCKNCEGWLGDELI